MQANFSQWSGSLLPCVDLSFEWGGVGEVWMLGGKRPICTQARAPCEPRSKPGGRRYWGWVADVLDKRIEWVYYKNGSFINGPYTHSLSLRSSLSLSLSPLLFPLSP